MKYLLFSVLSSFLLVFNAHAMGPEYSGSWYNSEQSGHGFSIEYGAAPDGTPKVVVYWYVYDAQGFPVFLTGDGIPDDTGVFITFSAHQGMLFGYFDPVTLLNPNGGVARFEFQDANNGTFEYFPSIWTEFNWGHTQLELPITKLFAVTSDVVVSQLTSTWEGWSGNTTIELANGQWWNQIELYDEPLNLESPNVVIYSRDNSKYAAVEGSDKHVLVEQVK